MPATTESSLPSSKGRKVMQTIGLFAGRGDVVLSMLITFGGGIWVGYQLNILTGWIKSKFNKN